MVSKINKPGALKLGGKKMSGKFTIGIDFGTQSARALLTRVADGKEMATAIYEYANGVITDKLPLNEGEEEVRLGTDWALQDPDDYLKAFYQTIPAVLEESEVSAENVIGLGIDFTSCTMLPIDKDGKPLCKKEKYKKNPHAWVKLWKHHAAQNQADKLNDKAKERKEAFLQRYGGKISSEWLIPKIWQILEEDPEIYQAADAFIEAADWVIMQLTGNKCRNISVTGYKAIWSKADGYPEDFFAALHPDMAELVEKKLTGKICALGEKAGNLKPKMADKLNLTTNTAVAVGNVDSFVSVPAVTVTEPGKMVMVMGTSICHMVLDKERHFVEGMTGCIKNGILPGFYGYEAGQAAVGDIFAWFVDNCVSEEYYQAAKENGLSIHEYLEKKAAALKPGESGLLALDWWNGNRSILVDANLSGLILGLTLDTKPEEIYRALIEATAFGTRRIIKAFSEGGVAIEELYACGGLPYKNKMLMEIYADVSKKPIKVAVSEQTPALGSAMHGAVAAGQDQGGYADIFQASKNMAGLKDEVFLPRQENSKIYDKLFAEYETLHDYFGRGENEVMKRLKTLKQSFEDLSI